MRRLNLSQGRTIQSQQLLPMAGVLSAVLVVFAVGFAARQSGDPIPVKSSQWATVTAPVYGTSESGAYSGAELFAGPNKFGSYFKGVLPNGRIVKPAGISAQIGMNPLGAALTPDGKFLITSNDDERDSGLSSYQSATNKGG